ncbi:MAG: hypothetical protein WCD35_12285, partial [Mycobacteriales bacterium]
MSSPVVQRPGRWALPPTPPERWVGSRASLLLVVCAGLAAGLPSVLVLPGARGAATALAVLYGVGGLTITAVTYLLTVQATVTQDRRLAWAAGGYVLMLLVELARSTNHALPGVTTDAGALRISATLSVLWLLPLPAAVLTAGLRRRGQRWFAVPAAVVALAAGGCYALG